MVNRWIEAKSVAIVRAVGSENALGNGSLPWGINWGNPIDALKLIPESLRSGRQRYSFNYAKLLRMSVLVRSRQGRISNQISQSSHLNTRISVVVLVVVYLLLALTFSLLTRAYEDDDEQAHTQYIEYVVRNDSIPHISTVNLQESHQPPLYYLLAAGWQELLHIPAFTPVVVREHNKDPFIPNRLMLSHDYTATQHREAVYLHELRLLSVLFGLGTVLLTYAGAKVIGMRESVALAAGLFVALLPRELVVSTSVTNDALVIPLCAAALVLYLLAERARVAKRLGHRRLYIFGMGLALGAAATTKFNSLPLAAVLLLLTFVPSIRLPHRPSNQLALSTQPPPGRLESDAVSGSEEIMTGASNSPLNGKVRQPPVDLRMLIDAGIAVAGFFAVSGWWFVRNKHLYGQFLATKASENYLLAFFLHPVPWNAHLLFRVFPQTFFISMWYSQPNLFLPTWANQVLAVFGLLCLATGVWIFLARRQWVAQGLSRLSALAILGCVASGPVAVLVTIKSTSIGDARVAFIGLSAFALVAVVSASRLARLTNPRLERIGLMAWPTVLLAADLYVIVHILVPLGGL